MQDGTYRFYTIQHRLVAQSPWLRPDEPLVPAVKKDPWAFSGWERITEPWCGRGNAYRPRSRNAYTERYAVWDCTGYKGWWTLAYAQKALQRLEAANRQGRLDHTDPYGKKAQAVRYEFRVVEVQVSRTIRPVLGDCRQPWRLRMKHRDGRVNA